MTSASVKQDVDEAPCPGADVRDARVRQDHAGGQRSPDIGKKLAEP